MTLAQLLNQNSFLIAVIAALGGSCIALIARRARRRAWLVWMAAVTVAIGIYFAMRTTPSRAFGSAADVQQAVTAGRPTLVEFYSDF